MTLRFATVCSGVEAVSLGWEHLNFQPIFFSEIEPFPKALLAHRFPHVPDLGNLLDIRGEDWAGKVDIFWGSTPCFPRGALVATSTGMKPIEDIRPGDEVLTHERRYRRVLRVGSKIADTVIVQGQGHYGLETTSNHRFLSRKRSSKGFSDQKWTPASHLTGEHWACVAEWPTLEIPKLRQLSGQGAQLRSFELNEDFFRIVGAYLGDGWLRNDKQHKSVILGINDDKLEKLRPSLETIGNFTVTRERTGPRVTISSVALEEWLREHFGVLSDGKRVPHWVFGMPLNLRKAIIEGYLLTDGSLKTNGHIANTVGRDFAITLRILAVSSGYASSIRLNKVSPTKIIEGRVVNQRDYYSVSFSISTRSSVPMSGMRWQCVRSVKPGNNNVEVFDLEIEEDHSYTVDGIVVHNCQAFSLAGKRESLSDARGGLTLKFCDLANEINPQFVCWENVKGALNAPQNAFGCLLGSLSGEGSPLEPPGGKWTHAGYVSGPSRNIAWRLFDAQYSGVAQRRERLFVVGCPTDGPDPRDILFEQGTGDQTRKPTARQAEEHASEDRPRVRAHAVAFRGRAGGEQAELGGEVSNCLRASQGGSDKAFVLIDDSVQPVVRQMTPLECERLMGFPDFWTDVPFNGASACDTVRYKAIGNSIAVPDVRWIGERIAGAVL